MPVTLSLELISQDARSKEATYAFQLNNYCEYSISVQLDELLPKGTSVQRGISDRQRQFESEVRRECARLERLLKEFHKALRKEGKSSGAQLSPRDVGFDPWWQALTPYSVAGSILRALGLGDLAEPRRGSDEEHARNLVPDLRNPKVVLQLAKDLLWEPEDDSRVTALRQACNLQVKRVEMLQESVEDDKKKETIARGSSLTRTYIIDSRKHWLRLRRRVVRIEAHYQEVPAVGVKAMPGVAMETESITVVHTVAPLAFPVTVFAMVGALAALAMKTPVPSLDLARAIPILVLAAVFYNVYDLTNLGQKISGTLDWRGALVVGLMCGLLGSPILDALEGSFSKSLDIGRSSSPSSPSATSAPTESAGDPSPNSVAASGRPMP